MGVGTRIYKVWGIPATGIRDELFRKAKLRGIGDGAVEREGDNLRARELVSLADIIGKLAAWRIGVAQSLPVSHTSSFSGRRSSVVLYHSRVYCCRH